MKIFGIRDKLTGSIEQYFFSKNRQTAARQVFQLMEDHNTTIGAYPGDYDLVDCGSIPDAASLPDDAFCECTGLSAWYAGGEKREQH